MKKTFADLPDWTFEMDEVSASVYEVIGKDSSGRIVSAKGIDLDSLIEQCRMEACTISAQNSTKLKQWPRCAKYHI